MEKNINKRFGERVKEIRKSKGFSQKELSEKTGINRSYISGIERGEKNSTLSNVSKIAEGLEVPISLLFLDTEIEKELEKDIGYSNDFNVILRWFAVNMLGSTANFTVHKKIEKLEDKIESILKKEQANK